MKRGLVALLLLSPLSLTACSDGDDKPTYQQQLMDACYSDGGVYFEYEATSAGGHIWCVGPDGKDIAAEVSEGDQ